MKLPIKKSLYAFLALAMLLNLAACSSKPTQDSSLSSDTSALESSSDSEVGSATSDTTAGSDASGVTSNQTTQKNGSTQKPSSNSTSGKYTLPKVKLSNKKLKLYVGVHEDDKDWHSAYPELPSAIDMYQKQYSGTYEFVKTTWGDYNTNLLAMYLANDMPDLLYSVPWKFPKTYLSNFVQAVDGYKDYINVNDSIWNDTRDMINKYKIGGKVYYPISGYSKPIIMMYNPQLFDLYDLEKPLDVYKKNPSKWTWSLFLEYAKELTVVKSGKVTQYGVGFGGEGVSALQYSTGVAIVDYDAAKKTVTHNLKSSKIADAMNFAYDLHNKYNVVSTVRADQMRPEFLKGNIAMLFDYTWTAETTFAELWPDKMIECVPMPRYNANSKDYVDGRWGAWSIASKAKNPQAAALYIAISKYSASNQYYTDHNTSAKFVKYMYNDVNKIPRDQSDLLFKIEADFKSYPRVDGSTGVGFYDQGQYYPINDTVMTKPWSQILESIYPNLDAALKENYSKLKKNGI